MKEESKILYVTDLDGTLLNSDQALSAYTVNTINALLGKGMSFSYATARSSVTACKITKDITVKMPIIVYNGVFILESISKDILYGNYFSHHELQNVLSSLTQNEVYPIVYSYINNAEKFSYLSDKVNASTRDFINTRTGDGRDNPISHFDDFYKGNSFYFSCIDTEEKLYPLYQKFADTYSCVYHKDIYSGKQWLEIMPSSNKAKAILHLKKLLGCKKIIAFGDGINDLAMFEMADECYAVDNAVAELKKIATGIIGSNDQDGVAKWLSSNVKL